MPAITCNFAAGEITANLLKVVHPALRIELRTALFKAEQMKETVRAAPQAIEVDGQTEAITVSVCPIRQDGVDEDYFLVLFEQATRSRRPPARARPSTTRSIATSTTRFTT